MVWKPLFLYRVAFLKDVNSMTKANKQMCSNFISFFMIQVGVDLNTDIQSVNVFGLKKNVEKVVFVAAWVTLYVREPSR